MLHVSSFESYGLRNIEVSSDPSDCIRLLSPYTQERSVWTTAIERCERARVLENMHIAFNDLRYSLIMYIYTVLLQYNIITFLY
jgi:hypothetical protein